MTNWKLFKPVLIVALVFLCAAAVFGLDEAGMFTPDDTALRLGSRQPEIVRLVRQKLHLHSCRDHEESFDFYRSWACHQGYDAVAIESYSKAMYERDKRQAVALFADCLETCRTSCPAKTHSCSCGSDGAFKCAVRTDVKHVSYKPLEIGPQWSTEERAGWISVLLIAQKNPTENGVYWVPEGTTL